MVLSKAMETLKEMAKLTMLSNKLNDIQLKNLSMFPLIFFNKINQVTVDYDLSNNLAVDTEEDSNKLDIKYTFESATQHLTVKYLLETNESVEQDSLAKRFDALETSVRGILWKDINVKVYINNKLLIESTK